MLLRLLLLLLLTATRRPGKAQLLLLLLLVHEYRLALPQRGRHTSHWPRRQHHAARPAGWRAQCPASCRPGTRA